MQDFNEKCRDVGSYAGVSLDRSWIAPGADELPKSVIAKLRFYSSGGQQPVDITPGEVVLKMCEAEGRQPGDYAPMIANFAEYDVVYPNMFLSERRDGVHLLTEFTLKGAALRRTDSMAAAAARKVTTSGRPIHKTVNPEGATDYIYSHFQYGLMGPFPCIVDVSDQRPLLVLQDMSYTGVQLFRAFAGVYCDYTPVFNLSKLDFLEFSYFHETGHKKTEDLIASHRIAEYLPGIEIGVDKSAMSHKNLVETVADVFGVLKFIQRSGRTDFPEQLAVMRTLSTFSPKYQEFETAASIYYRRSGRKRVSSEYYTTPGVREAIATGRKMYQAGELQRLSEDDLVGLAVSISQRFRLSEQALEELSVLATTLNFNVHANLPQDIQCYKRGLSPEVVDFALQSVGRQGQFAPRGGDALEGFLYQGQESASVFHKESIPVSDEMRVVFDDYHRSVQYLNEHGIRPGTTEFYAMLSRELVSTIGLLPNQTPNMTVARELDDAFAGCGKYLAFEQVRRWRAVGLRCLITNDKEASTFELAERHARGTFDSRIDIHSTVLSWFLPAIK